MRVGGECTPAEPFRTRTDDHAGFERRMPLRAAGERGAAKRHALIDRAVIANFRRFTNHHAHAVIDEYTPPERRAGMDLDAGQETRELRDKPSEPAPARSPARMCDPVQHNRVNARITRHHFPSAARPSIPLPAPSALSPASLNPAPLP